MVQVSAEARMFLAVAAACALASGARTDAPPPALENVVGAGAAGQLAASPVRYGTSSAGPTARYLSSGSCSLLQYLPSVEVFSSLTGSGDDDTAYVTCPSTHPTLTSCACDREPCDGAYIRTVSGTDRCHAYNPGGGSGVKARAICVVGT